MSDRDFEDFADEYDGLNFHQAASRFAATFASVSLGELMAMGGRYLELARGANGTTEDERATCSCLAEAVGEVILLRLQGNPNGLEKYLEAKRSHLEYLDKYLPSASLQPKQSAPSGSASFSWFGKRR